MKKYLGYLLAACLALTGCGMEPGTALAEAAEIPEAMDWREAYRAQLSMLCGQDAEQWGKEDRERPLGCYWLYDIDKDSVPELLVQYGSCEADRRTDVYGWEDDAVKKLGDFPSGHSSLYAWPGENAVALHYGQMMVERIDKISVADGALRIETLREAGLDEPLEEYTDMAAWIPGSECLADRCAPAVAEGELDDVTGVYTQTPNTALIDRYGKARELDFTYDEARCADWQRAYADFLRKLCRQEAAVRNIERPDYDPNAYAAEIGALSSGCCLYDINEDGIPEMFLRYGNCEAAYRTCVYGWVDGAAVELGEFPSGHSSLYTWPGENAVAFDWGHMGGHYVQKISLTDSTLTFEDVFSEYVEPGEEYTDIADIVPGSTVLREARTTLGLTFSEGAGSGADRPLLLPIYDYGRERPAAEMDPDRDEAAQRAITAVLEDGAEFYGVSADGFGGDTGWATLEQYLAPGGVDRFADTPQTVEKLAWVDMDQDGQRECVLRLLDGREGWADQYIIFREQDGTVYAYCVNYCVSHEIGTDGVFRDAEWQSTFAVSFWKNQCYLYTVPCGGTVPAVEWEML